MQRAGWIGRHFALVGPLQAWKRANEISKRVWAPHPEERKEIDRLSTTLYAWVFVALLVYLAIVVTGIFTLPLAW